MIYRMVRLGTAQPFPAARPARLGIANAQAADSGTPFTHRQQQCRHRHQQHDADGLPGKCCLPIITGPAYQTVVQTSNAMFSVSVSGLPVAHLAMAGERHRHFGSDQFLTDCFQCPIFTERFCVFTGGRQRRRHGDEQRQSVRSSKAADHYATTDQPHGGDRQSGSFQRRCERCAIGEISVRQELQPDCQCDQRVLQHRQCARCG